MILGKFQPKEVIGYGSYGVVFSAVLQEEYKTLECGDVVAIKEILATRVACDDDMLKLTREIDNMSKIKSDHCVKLYGFEKDPSKFYIIMEYCESGDLHQFIRTKRNYIDEKLVYSFAMQIGEALKELQSHNMIHRDLKPHNILLKGSYPDLRLKIADFGLSRCLGDNCLANTLCGSPNYMAPEVILRQEYDSSADMWSIGVILYELVTGSVPFPNAGTTDDLKDELKSIGNGFITLPMDKGVSTNLRQLIEQLLCTDKNSRLNLDQYLKHEFFMYQYKKSRKFSIKNFGDVPKHSIITQLIQSSELTENFFTDCQMNGNGVLFDLITMMCEYIMDVIEDINLPDDPDINALLEKVDEFREEAAELNKLGYNQEKLDETAITYLYKKAIELVNEGIDLERNKCIDYALFKYKRSILLLSPLVYLTDDSPDLKSVNNIYNGILRRINKLEETEC